MKSTRTLGVLAFLVCLIVITLALLSSPSLYAQTVTQAFDPGPRPTGTTSVNCGPNTKFPNDSNCIDVAQPSTAGTTNPFADGAGNVVTNNGTPSGPLVGLWFQSITVFETFATVNGLTNAGTKNATILGLGPSFNAESCFECHSQPTVGGTSSGKVTIVTLGGVTKTFESTVDPLKFTAVENDNFTQNPEINSATDDFATNSIPCFLQKTGTCVSGGNFFNGPVVETRFINAVPADPVNHIDAVAAGGVGELFVFAGRHDLPPNSTCKIGQEDFQTQIDNKNISFRMPTPTFGLGFVENTSDPTLVEAAQDSAAAAAAAGITGINFGVFNRTGNDGTITRFGWKAQNKSLLLFAGEASNVEMGVTDEIFPNEKTFGGDPSNQSCVNFNDYPEDQILVFNPTPTDPTNSSQSAVIENDAVFMRLNGAPSQCLWSSAAGVCNSLSTDPNTIAGEQLFGSIVLASGSTTANVGIGCVLCHTDVLTTGPSVTGGLGNATFHPFSDFALHHMGAGDADHVTQGNAGGDQFRPAPLWGAGQRLFFFHDGRATNLVDAIQDHCPVASQTATAEFPVGEACQVVNKFNALTATQKQDILKFLRSL